MTDMPQEPAAIAGGLFGLTQFTIRRKIFKLFGGAFHVYDPDKNVVGYSKQKAFKLKEDIRLYTGEDMQVEMLTIQARQIVDFSAAYDVVDATNGTKIGAFKRKGWKSILKDEWIVMDPNDQEIGLIKEDSAGMAFIRRFIFGLLPQRYHVEFDGRTVCEYKQTANPFVSKITADYSQDPQGTFDRRMGVAGAILLCAIEGKQE